MVDYAEGRPLSEIDSNALATYLLQENPCYVMFKVYINKFQYCFETSQQRIWTEVPQPDTKATPDNSDEKKRDLILPDVSHWTFAEWKKVMFSDKCIMHEFVPRHRHFRRSLGKCFDKKYVVATMKRPPSQMIWGDMLYRDAVGLYFIPPNTAVNGPMYMELLREKLKLHMHVHMHSACTSTTARSLCKMAFLVTNQR